MALRAPPELWCRRLCRFGFEAIFIFRTDDASPAAGALYELQTRSGIITVLSAL